MIGDYMIKTFQGSMFSKSKDKIMGVLMAADPGLGKVKIEKLRKL